MKQLSLKVISPASAQDLKALTRVPLESPDECLTHKALTDNSSSSGRDVPEAEFRRYVGFLVAFSMDASTRSRRAVELKELHKG